MHDFNVSILNAVHPSLQLELLEALLGSSALRDLQHVELDGLGQRTSLTHGRNISDLNVPGRSKREREVNKLLPRLKIRVIYRKHGDRWQLTFR